MCQRRSEVLQVLVKYIADNCILFVGFHVTQWLQYVTEKTMGLAGAY